MCGTRRGPQDSEGTNSQGPGERPGFWVHSGARENTCYARKEVPLFMDVKVVIKVENSPPAVAVILSLY